MDFTYNGFRAPYQDSLKIGRFSRVEKLTNLEVSTIEPGDKIVMYDAKGNVIRYNGEEVQLVIDSVPNPDSSEYKLVVTSANPIATFSSINPPPFEEGDLEHHTYTEGNAPTYDELLVLVIRAEAKATEAINASIQAISSASSASASALRAEQAAEQAEDIIDDSATSGTESTWSIDKIKTEIASSVGAEIDDEHTSTLTTWSSSKIHHQILNAIPVNVSYFANDSGYITKNVGNLINYYTKANTYTKTEVNSLISGAGHVSFNFMSGRPSVGQENVIYFISRQVGEAEYAYDKYIYHLGSWEYLGGSHGTIDYSDLTNKPKVNGVTLSGDVSLVSLGIAPANTTYSKTEVDSRLASKTTISTNGTEGTATLQNGLTNPISATFYTKVKVDELLSGLLSLTTDVSDGTFTVSGDNKSATTYTKSSVDSLLVGKLDNPNPTPEDDGKYLKYSYDASTQQGFWVMGTGSGGGQTTTDYTDLANKPKINSVEITGNKSSADLKVADTVVVNNVEKKLTAGTSKINIGNVITGVKRDGALVTPDSNGVVNIPVIDDSQVTNNRTYSSSKINSALGDKVGMNVSGGVITLSDDSASSTSYTASKADELLGAKANSSDVYTKSQVDTSLANKANVSDVYAKTNTYSKSEVDSALALKISDPQPESSDEGKVLTWDGESWVADGLPVKPYSSLRRLRSYLYEVTFDELPAYSESGDAPFTGGCTSFIRNGKLHRNLDWNYSETAAFKVVTKDFVGMAFNDSVKEGSLDDFKIGQLPYHVNDGVNDYGIMVTTHVLYNDWNWNNASGHTSITKLPYIILSTVKSMDELSSKLSTVLSDLYAPDALKAMGYLVHFMVSDGTTTYVIEPPTSATGAYQLINASDCPKFANFRWINKAEITSRNDSALQNRPNGIERWNLVPCELSDLRYTKAYETNAWLSEFIGVSETTKASTDAQLQAIYELGHTAYLSRTRNDEVPTWQTFYSVVYSNKGMEHLWAQEDWNRDYCSSTGVWERGSGANSVIVSGSQSLASGDYATAEGFANRASGTYSHAEGVGNIISIDSASNPDWNEGIASHLEGSGNTAAGNYAHVEGANNLANNIVEHAEGQYNKSNMHSTTFGDALNTLHSVGIGTNDNARKNAEEIMQNGDQYVIGVGGYDGTNPSASDTLQEVIGGKITAPASASNNQVLTYDSTNGWVAKNPTGGSAPTVVGTTLVFS